MTLTVIPLSRQKIKLSKRFEKGDTTIQTVGRFRKDSTNSYIVGKQFLVVSPGTANAEGLYINQTGNPSAVSGLTNVYTYSIASRGIESDNAAVPPNKTDTSNQFDHEAGAVVAIVNDISVFLEMNATFESVVNGSQTKIMSAVLFEPTTNISVGDGRIVFPPLGSIFASHNLTRVFASVTAATALGTTGTTTIQVHNLTDGSDMLSTKLTIDAGERDSSTAATAAVINLSEDDVTINDLIRIDIDTTCSTPAKGLNVTLEFTLIT